MIHRPINIARWRHRTCGHPHILWLKNIGDLPELCEVKGVFLAETGGFHRAALRTTRYGAPLLQLNRAAVR